MNDACYFIIKDGFRTLAAAICEIFQYDFTSLMYKAGLKLEGLHVGKRAQGFV